MLQKNKIEIFNITIDNLSMDETVCFIKETIEAKKQIHHSCINADKIVALQTDRQLQESINASNLVNADGQAVVWAAKFLNKPLKERVAGIDLMENLVELANKNNYKIFLFGAKEEVVKKVVAIYTKKYGSDLIAGYRNGYYQKNKENFIANDIALSGANMLFVAITSPKKENFLFEFKNELTEVNLIMGVGGSFDVIAGLTKRAPLWMQNSGLEWFYRFLEEPKRMWKRYLIGNSKFIYLVFKEKGGSFFNTFASKTNLP